MMPRSWPRATGTGSRACLSWGVYQALFPALILLALPIDVTTGMLGDSESYDVTVNASEDSGDPALAGSPADTAGRDSKLG
jgi:hypothetical protein